MFVPLGLSCLCLVKKSSLVTLQNVTLRPNEKSFLRLFCCSCQGRNGSFSFAAVTETLLRFGAVTLSCPFLLQMTVVVCCVRVVMFFCCRRNLQAGNCRVVSFATILRGSLFSVALAEEGGGWRTPLLRSSSSSSFHRRGIKGSQKREGREGGAKDRRRRKEGGRRDRLKQ